MAVSRTTDWGRSLHCELLYDSSESNIRFIAMWKIISIFIEIFSCHSNRSVSCSAADALAKKNAIFFSLLLASETFWHKRLHIQMLLFAFEFNFIEADYQRDKQMSPFSLSLVLFVSGIRFSNPNFTLANIYKGTLTILERKRTWTRSDKKWEKMPKKKKKKINSFNRKENSWYLLSKHTNTETHKTETGSNTFMHFISSKGTIEKFEEIKQNWNDAKCLFLLLLLISVLSINFYYILPPYRP